MANLTILPRLLYLLVGVNLAVNDCPQRKSRILAESDKKHLLVGMSDALDLTGQAKRLLRVLSKIRRRCVEQASVDCAISAGPTFIDRLI